MTTVKKRYSCLIPIVIGITGHRDPRDDDIPRLKSELTDFFQKMHMKYLDTPLILLSLLAEGADRLAADVVLKLQAKEIPIKLIVPLPLPKEEYKKDFNTEESKVYFDAILAREDVIHFELPPLKDDSNGINSEHGELRNKHYLAGGRFVVEHCQILIALWDGVHNSKTGGTSDVVEMQLDGDTRRNDESENILNPLTTGPVYHIVTRRKSHSSADMPNPDANDLTKYLHKKQKLCLEPFSLNHLYPFNEITGKSLKREKEEVLKNINDYNLDLKDNHEKLKHKSNSESHDLLPTGDYCPPELEAFKKYYAFSSTIAIEYKNKVVSLLKFIVYSMPLTVLTFEYYSNMEVSHAFWVLYVILAGSANLYYLLSKKGRNHDKFLDYRALAEGLRVHFYWKLAGIKKSAATFYLTKHLGELEWIRYAIKNLDLLILKQIECDMKQEADDKTTADLRSQESIKNVTKTWVDGQKNYFKGKSAEQQKIHDVMEKLSNIVFFFTLLVTTPALLVNHTLYPGGHADHWFHIIVPVLFVISGAIKFYTEKMLYKQNSKQYRRMLDTFSRASVLLNNVAHSSIPEDDKVKDSQKILLFLGKEALSENGDWLLMHRDQPIEVPQKG